MQLSASICGNEWILLHVAFFIFPKGQVVFTKPMVSSQNEEPGSFFCSVLGGDLDQLQGSN